MHKLVLTPLLMMVFLTAGCRKAVCVDQSLSVFFEDFATGDTIVIESFAQGSNFSERYSRQLFAVQTTSAGETWLRYGLEGYEYGLDYRFTVVGTSEEWRLTEIQSLQRKEHAPGIVSEMGACANHITYRLNGDFTQIDGQGVIDRDDLKTSATITIRR